MLLLLLLSLLLLCAVAAAVVVLAAVIFCSVFCCSCCCCCRCCFFAHTGSRGVAPGHGLVHATAVVFWLYVAPALHGRSQTAQDIASHRIVGEFTSKRSESTCE